MILMMKIVPKLVCVETVLIQIFHVALKNILSANIIKNFL